MEWARNDAKLGPGMLILRTSGKNVERAVESNSTSLQMGVPKRVHAVATKALVKVNIYSVAQQLWHLTSQMKVVEDKSNVKVFGTEF